MKRLVGCALVFALAGAVAAMAPKTRFGLCYRAPGWLYNTSKKSTIFHDVAGAGLLVDVQCGTPVVSVGTGEKFWIITATDIPDYDKVVDQDDIDNLNGRDPNDFRPGGPTVALGNPIEFGQDIGFRKDKPLCLGSEGSGYWPPGPACPTAWSPRFVFPQTPRDELASPCYTNKGAIGKWLNGVSMFNYWDGQSWDSDCDGTGDSTVWHRVAYYWEAYDLDICQGHAADNPEDPTTAEYHHHSYPECLGKRLGDDGTHVSPILGYAADGSPVLGPWVAAGSLARTCWKTRDYDSGGLFPTTGCGGGGVRSCILRDPMNPALGTYELSAFDVGPSTSETQITTCTPGHLFDYRTIPTVSRVFVEDYYWDGDCFDSTLAGQLDEHNGHQGLKPEKDEFRHVYKESLHYHYHTVRVDDGNGGLVDVFPFTVGPTFRGHVPATTLSNVTAVPCTSPW